jgi:hypothetical protein
MNKLMAVSRSQFFFLFPFLLSPSHMLTCSFADGGATTIAHPDNNLHFRVSAPKRRGNVLRRMSVLYVGRENV